MSENKKTTIVTTTDEKYKKTCSEMGKIGGPLGGLARAKSLSKKRRKEIAKLAAQARWKKRNK